MASLHKTLALALFVISIPWACADQGSFTNSGGSGSGGAGISVTSPVASPAGTLSMNCPGVGPTTCSGGGLTFSSNDGTTLISAVFTSGTFAEGCAGGGKGGHVTCGYSFAGYFSGTLTVNGAAQAIIGVTYQGFDVSGGTAPPTGTTAYNSAYTPFYYSDTEQIHRSDDLQGTNQISFGSQGSDVGQFYGAYGIALDSTGRIYIADTYNCRVVRIDDMNGTNWTSFGTCGAGQGEFYDPSGIALDAAGKIYIMDSGNCRVVRIDDLTGANWIAYGAVCSGNGQFAQYLTSLAVDSAARIYVADTGNKRLVRIDDMTGANWTVLTQSPVVNGVSYSLQSPIAVALDATGRIYIADAETYQPAVIRVDDMTGSNWTSLFTGPNGGLNSIAIDSSGMVFLGAGGVKVVDGMAAVLSSSGAIGPIGPAYVYAVTPLKVPAPRPAAVSLSPSALSFAQDPGVFASQTVKISNFGGSPLNFTGISATGGFSQINTCSNQLIAGSTCTVAVTFAPAVVESVSGQLSVNDDSGNLGAAQAVSLTGIGLAQYPLTIVANPTAGGSVTPSSDMLYDEGTVVTLTAEPNTHYRFIAWTGDVMGNSNPTTVTMDAAKSVVAHFAVPIDSCTANQNGKASVSDVQMLINESAGANLPIHDLNEDGVVDVTDVQIVVNAVLKLGCNTGG